MSAEGVQLYDREGRRKYLTGDERQAFLRAAEKAPRQVRTLCLVLAFTGCRISVRIRLWSVPTASVRLCALQRTGPTEFEHGTCALRPRGGVFARPAPAAAANVLGAH